MHITCARMTTVVMPTYAMSFVVTVVRVTMYDVRHGTVIFAMAVVVMIRFRCVQVFL